MTTEKDLKVRTSKLKNLEEKRVGQDSQETDCILLIFVYINIIVAAVHPLWSVLSFVTIGC